MPSTCLLLALVIQLYLICIEFEKGTWPDSGNFDSLKKSIPQKVQNIFDVDDFYMCVVYLYRFCAYIPNRMWSNMKVKIDSKLLDFFIFKLKIMYAISKKQDIFLPNVVKLNSLCDIFCLHQLIKPSSVL